MKKGLLLLSLSLIAVVIFTTPVSSKDMGLHDANTVSRVFVDSLWNAFVKIGEGVVWVVRQTINGLRTWEKQYH